ncbi:unnamed protein product, partial [Trichogramma brassicae]
IMLSRLHDIARGRRSRSSLKRRGHRSVSLFLSRSLVRLQLERSLRSFDAIRVMLNVCLPLAANCCARSRWLYIGACECVRMYMYMMKCMCANSLRPRTQLAARLYSGSLPPRRIQSSKTQLEKGVPHARAFPFSLSLLLRSIKTRRDQMEDEGNHGNDDTRCFILSTLAALQWSRVSCVLCRGAMLVFDRYPLVDGTFFLSPRQHSTACAQVKVEGRTQFLSAVCMSCLEGSGGSPVRCRSCTQPWDGSSLVLGTMYSYDIFAAMPCCTERLKENAWIGRCGEYSVNRSHKTRIYKMILNEKIYLKISLTFFYKNFNLGSEEGFNEYIRKIFEIFHLYDGPYSNNQDFLDHSSIRVENRTSYELIIRKITDEIRATNLMNFTIGTSRITGHSIEPGMKERWRPQSRRLKITETFIYVKISLCAQSDDKSRICGTRDYMSSSRMGIYKFHREKIESKLNVRGCAIDEQELVPRTHVFRINATTRTYVRWIPRGWPRFMRDVLRKN